MCRNREFLRRNRELGHGNRELTPLERAMIQICSAGSNRGLEATYTEHNSITSEKPENRSKSWARNHLNLQLKELLGAVIGAQQRLSLFP
jgi:hypothetical protein